MQTRVTAAAEAAKDEVWAGYRFVALGDAQTADGLKVIDLGAVHASASETLSEIEHGRKPGSVAALARVAEAVGTTIDALVVD